MLHVQADDKNRSSGPLPHTPSPSFQTTSRAVAFASQQVASFFIAETLDLRQQRGILLGGDSRNLHGFNTAGKVGEREARRVDVVNGNLDAERLTDAHQQKHCKQGMAAKVEEAVRPAD